MEEKIKLDWIGNMALLLSSFVASCESMKSANICFLISYLLKKRSRTRQCRRAFPGLKVNDYKNSTSVNFCPAGLFIIFYYFSLGHFSQSWETRLPLKFSDSSDFFPIKKKATLKPFAMHCSSFATRHWHLCQKQVPNPVIRGRHAGAGLPA